MGLAPSQDSRTTVAQSPPASLLYLEQGSDLSVWEVEGIFFVFSFLFTCSRTWTSPVLTLDLIVTA